MVNSGLNRDSYSLYLIDVDGSEIELDSKGVWEFSLRLDIFDLIDAVLIMNDSKGSIT